MLLLQDFVGKGGESHAALEALLAAAALRIGGEGVLLLAVPNRFGLRFWSGFPEPGTGRLFSPLTSRMSADGPLLVSRRELADLLTRSGLEALEWFFPVTSWGELSSLLSEQFAVAAPQIASDIATDRPFADPLRPRIDLFPEALVSREIARAGLFTEFANHFLVAAAASRENAIWQRLRPDAREIGWHYAADRKLPIETVFELGESGITVSKRQRDIAARVDFGDYSWIGTEGAPLASGEAFRLRLQEHLVADRIEQFFRDFEAFYDFICARFRRDGNLAGEAIDAILTNATRDEAGVFHLFDREWKAHREITPSWWILRNVLACLEMRGQPTAALPTGRALYHELCARLGVEARFADDLASEAAFATAVRASPPDRHTAATAQSLERPWPVPVFQEANPTAIRAAMERAAVHQRLLADYRRLESWAAELHAKGARVEAEYLKLEAWAHDLDSQLLRQPENPSPSAAPAAVETPPPRIRVIVIHHRNTEQLEYCLRGVLASTGVDLDVVLFENACRETLPAWIAGEERIHRIASEESIGFGEANNRAVAWSRAHLPSADAYFFLNNDAVVRPDTVRRLASVFVEHPESAAVGPLILIWGAEDHLNSCGLNLSDLGEAWDEGIGMPVASRQPLPGRREVLAVTGSAMLVRRAAFEAAGGWSELFDFYMEDLDLCLRVRRNGQSVWLEPRAVVAHAVSATAGPESEFKLFLFQRNRWILMLLHWPWRRLLRTLPRLMRRDFIDYRARREAGAVAEADRQLRAWRGALARLPRILAARLRHGGDESWWALLKPAGSVPVITLPEVVSRGRPWESVASVDAQR